MADQCGDSSSAKYTEGLLCTEEEEECCASANGVLLQCCLTTDATMINKQLNGE